ncbi:hypothetical protein LCGC14_2637320, partial [marine sediment metagenome]
MLPLLECVFGAYVVYVMKMNETQETAQKLLEYANPPKGKNQKGNNGRTRSNNPVAKMTRHKE